MSMLPSGGRFVSEWSVFEGLYFRLGKVVGGDWEMVSIMGLICTGISVVPAMFLLYLREKTFAEGSNSFHWLVLFYFSFPLILLDCLFSLRKQTQVPLVLRNEAKSLTFYDNIQNTDSPLDPRTRWRKGFVHQSINSFLCDCPSPRTFKLANQRATVNDLP